jgi:hypothetical protein
MQAVQAGTIADQPTATAAGVNRGVGYYAGLVTTDLQVDNKASGADMLKRSLQLAGALKRVLLAKTARIFTQNRSCATTWHADMSVQMHVMMCARLSYCLFVSCRQCCWVAGAADISLPSIQRPGVMRQLDKEFVDALA